METVSDSEYISILGYLPSTIIKNIIESRVNLSEPPQHYVTETVGLFSDISGFTKLSEAFSKKGRIGAEFLAYCINKYMEQIISIIGRHGGDIFKFVGDAIMVIWPSDGSKNFIEVSCKRALQCAMEIEMNLSNLEIVKGKFLNVKIGIGVGKCHILFVGGLFNRCEYLCVGECMRQACEAETHSSGGGQILLSEKVKKYIKGDYNFIKMDVQPGYKKNDNLDYYMIDVKNILINNNNNDNNFNNDKVKINANINLMRQLFDIKKLSTKVNTLRTFIPAAVKGYLKIEKESWCQENRLITSMFLNIKIDLSQLKNESSFIKVQNIINTVQRCVYRTRGSLNKFLMDDKGSVMYVVWGIPPYSSRNDPLDCVCSGMTILDEFEKLNLNCGMGVATGTSYTGICGTFGNRREYSLLGEIVNLSSRYMSKGLEYMKNNNLKSILVIDENTMNLIQNKIKCKYILTSKLKGFTNDFNFFVPIKNEEIFYPNLKDPFPFIRTHDNNPIPYVNYNDNINKNNLKYSLKLVGKQKEINIFVNKLQFIYKNNLKKFLLVKGQYGSGKSFFIRKCLYEFFNIKENKKLYEFYYNIHNESSTIKNPNIILCSFQYPLIKNIPFNGIAFIFRQIYVYLINNYNRQFNKFSYNDDNNFIEGDFFCGLICENNCIEYLNVIEEILNCSKSDIKLDVHFDRIEYEKNIKSIQKIFDKKRDPFFSKLNIDNINIIINFFIKLLIFYKDFIKKIFTKNFPLILVIEDINLIDEYTINFLEKILNENENSLKPLIIILSYQEQFKFLHNQNDLILNKKNFLKNDSLEEFKNNNEEYIVSSILIKNIYKINDIEKFIKNFYLEKNIFYKFDSLYKVDPILIKILINKSFYGIPIFLKELLNVLNEKKLIQNCKNEILITSELEDFEKENNYNDLTIPFRIEKICGEMIDSLNEAEIILLKFAACIGNFFDIKILQEILPFNYSLNELYIKLKDFEEKGIIEFLYDNDIKKNFVVCQFAMPFIKEVLYNRMLLSQTSEIHNVIAHKMQKNNISYYPSKFVENLVLKKHLEKAMKNNVQEMESANEESNNNNNSLALNNHNKNNNESDLDINSLKILLVKDIVNKLKYSNINNNNFIDEENLTLSSISSENSLQSNNSINYNNNNNSNKRTIYEKLESLIKFGILEKKSEGLKLTWEKRFFIMTRSSISYFYNKDDYLKNVVPLATFYLGDMYNIKQLTDYSIGNKSNIFTLSVTKWIKKGLNKTNRIYFFSANDLEEMYSWLISLKFMKVFAYYEKNFVNRFGNIFFPLYKKKTNVVLKHAFNVENTNFKNNDSNIIKRINTSINYRKKSNFKEQDYFFKNVNNLKIVKNILKFGFLILFGNVQENIYNKNDIRDYYFCNYVKCTNIFNYFNNLNVIKVPKHLKSIKNEKNYEKIEDNNNINFAKVMNDLLSLKNNDINSNENSNEDNKEIVNEKLKKKIDFFNLDSNNKILNNSNDNNNENHFDDSYEQIKSDIENCIIETDQDLTNLNIFINNHPTISYVNINNNKNGNNNSNNSNDTNYNSLECFDKLKKLENQMEDLIDEEELLK